MNTQPPISLDRRATDHTEPTYPQVERRQEMRLWRDSIKSLYESDTELADKVQKIEMLYSLLSELDPSGEHC